MLDKIINILNEDLSNCSNTKKINSLNEKIRFYKYLQLVKSEISESFIKKQIEELEKYIKICTDRQPHATHKHYPEVTEKRKQIKFLELILDKN
jgi:hypothetical protein